MKTRIGAALIAAMVALSVAPSAAAAAPQGVDLVAHYNSNGGLGYWKAVFRGTATTNDDGSYHIRGTLETRCPTSAISGFGRFGFHNQVTTDPPREYDIPCNGDDTTRYIEADATGTTGDSIGITVCMGGFLRPTECGSERTVTLS